MRAALKAILFRPASAPFTYPTDLGSSLLGLWDAENAASITSSAGLVSAWADLVGGYSLAQATGSLKPIYSATSFNGRPGVTFDGSDDYLALASVPFPNGSNPCEIWVLTDQTMLATNTQAGVIFGYGNETVAGRDIRRRVVSGVNRATTGAGTGSVLLQVSNTNVDFSGKHITRSVITSSDVTTFIAGNSSGATASISATGTARTHMGAAEGAGAGNYYGGIVNMVAVTGLLSVTQATNLYNFLAARKA